MIKVRLFSTFNQKELPAIWRHLIEAHETSTIFQTYEWLSTWWKYFGAGKKLQIFLVEKDGRPIGIAPLVMSNIFGLGQYHINFVGQGLCDYFDFIVKTGEENAFFATFFEYLKKQRWLETELKFFIQDSFTLNNFRDSINNYLFAELRDSDIVPYLPLSSSNGCDPLLNLKKNLKEDITRQERRLEKMGYINMYQCKKPEDLRKGLNCYFRLHQKRWSAVGGYSVFQSRKFRNFFYELAKVLLPKDNLDLSYLEFNGRRIACHFGYKYRGKFLYYIPAYDPEFAIYSPGNILVKNLIQLSDKQGLKEFDFGRGAEEYKFRWTKYARKVYSVFLYKKSLIGYSIGMALRKSVDFYERSLRNRVKKINPMVKFWHWIKSNY